MATATTPLDDERYINLETFKRDGGGVKTPVWAAPLDGKLVIFSAGDAFKVKRVRRDPRARAAGCDVRGKVHGPWFDGTCRVIEDPAGIERAHGALRKKYGLQMVVTDFFATLSGRAKRRAWLEVELGSPPAA